MKNRPADYREGYHIGASMKDKVKQPTMESYKQTPPEMLGFPTLCCL